MEQKAYNFRVTGGILMDENAEKMFDHQGNIIGFKTANGLVRLCLALEVEQPVGSFKYLSAEREMDKMGATLVNYEETDLFEIDEDKE